MALIEKRVAYHEQAYNVIKSKILGGEITAGEKIIESALSDELGISRSPVREALRILESEGILVKQGGGLAVRTLDKTETENIYDIRFMIESFVISKSTEFFTEDDIRMLRANVNHSRELHRQKDWSAVAVNNTEFHEFLCSKCVNQILLDYLRQIDFLSKLLRRKEFVVYERGVDYLDEHDAIIDALERKNADLVEQSVRNHIANDKKFAILSYDRILNE